MYATRPWQGMHCIATTFLVFSKMRLLETLDLLHSMSRRVWPVQWLQKGRKHMVHRAGMSQ
jgi:hypothetical protein